MRVVENRRHRSLQKQPKDIRKTSKRNKQAVAVAWGHGYAAVMEAAPVDVSSEQRGELRVGAHVLVQLGSELVTDVEQALLECVKNAYDADSPGCRISIETGES